MTTVRIARAEPQPGRLANGEFQLLGHLVVLADDARRRAVPIWMPGDPGADDLSQLVELGRRPAGEIVSVDAPEVLTARLLDAAGASVTEVDIDATGADIGELSPQVTVARIRLAGPAGTRDVTAELGLGLAMAAAAGAPVRIAEPLMDRLAVPVPGEDLLTPFLDRVPPAPGRFPATAWPAGRSPPSRDSGPVMSHATWISLTAWTGGTSIPGSAATVSRPGITPRPPTAGARSCPRPSGTRPNPRPWSRRSSPMTTAARWSSSAATSAPSH